MGGMRGTSCGLGYGYRVTEWVRGGWRLLSYLTGVLSTQPVDSPNAHTRTPQPLHPLCRCACTRYAQ